MKSVLITGGQGFIGTYLCLEFLSQGYKVISVDNFSKYGRVRRPQDSNPNFVLKEIDLLSATAPTALSSICRQNNLDYIIHCAARIGGIAYFHKYSYDIVRQNAEMDGRVVDAACDHPRLKRLIAMSSSMVFENATQFPTPEDHLKVCPIPSSTYGFSKLALEYLCKGAKIQRGLPYTIIRPFNAVGVYEDNTLLDRGNDQMMLSHVLPDLVAKALQTPADQFLEILGSGNQVRHYTNGKDIGRGVRLALESPLALNEDFNISHPTPYTVAELADHVWKQVHKTPLPGLKSLPSFEHDVQVRSPNVSKAERMLGFKAEISLDDSIREVVAWMRTKKSAK